MMGRLTDRADAMRLEMTGRVFVHGVPMRWDQMSVVMSRTMRTAEFEDTVIDPGDGSDGHT